MLLIIDDHCSRTKGFEIVNLARENNIVLLCFLHNTTHRLQPLDVSFMALLNAFYKKEARKRLINHPQHCKMIYQVTRLLRDAFLRPAIVRSAVKRFEKTGIYPFNRDILPEHLFATFETTRRPVDKD